MERRGEFACCCCLPSFIPEEWQWREKSATESAPTAPTPHGSLHRLRLGFPGRPPPTPRTSVAPLPSPRLLPSSLRPAVIARGNRQGVDAAGRRHAFGFSLAKRRAGDGLGSPPRFVRGPPSCFRPIRFLASFGSPSQTLFRVAGWGSWWVGF